MTAAVEREVSHSYLFLSSLMCRPWGIQLKRLHQPQGNITLGNFVGRQGEEGGLWI
jgi:hypothetical protein